MIEAQRYKLEAQRGGAVVLPEPTSDEWREIAAKAVSADLVDFLSGAAAYGLWLRGKIPQAIPADRVLGEGMVGVDREEWEAANDFALRYGGGWSIRALADFWGRWDALRSAKGEVTKTGKQWVEIGAESVNRLTPEDEKALEDWIPKKMPLILVRKAEKRLGVVENHALDTAAYVKAGNSNIPTPSTPAGWLRLEPGALTLPGEQTRIWNDVWQIEEVSGGKRHTVNRMVIVPSRSVPWGEGYMAVMFDEHMEDDEGYLQESETNAAGWYKMSCILPKRRSEVPIRRKLKRLRGAEGLAEKVQEIQGSKP